MQYILFQKQVVQVNDILLIYYRSDVGPDVGFEAVGLIDAKLQTVGVWARTKEDPPPAEVGVQCHLQAFTLLAFLIT